jgi:MFS family permease
VATLAFAAQGVSVAAVYTTVPAVTERVKLAPLLTTTTMVAVALMAGVGSFLGLTAIRHAGPVSTMRGALLTAAAALTLIGWAPGEASVICAYILFGTALGALDVGINTRAAVIERAYGRSVFGSFYTAWSVGGVVAALLTAAAARLEWPVADGLDVQAGILLFVAVCIRTHTVPSSEGPSATAPQPPLGRRVWIRLLPFGLVLLVVYVVDSTVSAWSAVYLRRTLAASLTVAPMAYAAYQAGTVVGRAATDRLVQRFGAVAVVRAAALSVAVALAGMAAAPSWPFAVLAAGAVGLGASVLAPAAPRRLGGGPGTPEPLQLRGRGHRWRRERAPRFHRPVPSRLRGTGRPGGSPPGRRPPLHPASEPGPYRSRRPTSLSVRQPGVRGGRATQPGCNQARS